MRAGEGKAYSAGHPGVALCPCPILNRALSWTKAREERQGLCDSMLGDSTRHHRAYQAQARVQGHPGLCAVQCVLHLAVACFAQDPGTLLTPMKASGPPQGRPRSCREGPGQGLAPPHAAAQVTYPPLWRTGPGRGHRLEPRGVPAAHPQTSPPALPRPGHMPCSLFKLVGQTGQDSGDNSLQVVVQAFGCLDLS